MPSSSRRHARTGAIALLLGAFTQVPASLLGAMAMPWAYAGWLALTFGALCLCDELGAARPLNRAGLIMLGVACAARTLMLLIPDPDVQIRSELAFALSSLLALLLWSAALMHRQDRPRAVGLLGALLSGSGLGLLVAAHVMVAGAGYLGFAQMFAAMERPGLQPDNAMISLSFITALWAGVTGLLLWSRDLRSGPPHGLNPGAR